MVTHGMAPSSVRERMRWPTDGIGHTSGLRNEAAHGRDHHADGPSGGLRNRAGKVRPPLDR
jgi:hypothetical protein